MLGKTETIKERAIYVYLPSIEQKGRWEQYAKRQGANISKFVAEHVEDSLKQVEDSSYKSSGELAKLITSKSRFSVILFISCLLGNISHVLLDVLTHQYNPIFWPFQTTTMSPIYTNQSSLVIHMFFVVFSLILFIIHRQNLWKELLVAC